MKTSTNTVAKSGHDGLDKILNKMQKANSIVGARTNDTAALIRYAFPKANNSSGSRSNQNKHNKRNRSLAEVGEALQKVRFNGGRHDGLDKTQKSNMKFYARATDTTALIRYGKKTENSSRSRSSHTKRNRRLIK